jgi:foldase protein PrsA
MRAKFIVALLVTVGFGGAIPSLLGCGGLEGNAAASVNGTVISKDNVASRIEELRKVYGAMIPTADQGDVFDNFRKETTDQLVREELELQQTKAKKISVSDAEIQTRFQDMADESFLGDVSRLKQDYAAKGLTEEEMNGDVRRAILHEKLMESIGKDIQVTDQEAEDYYDRNRSQYDQPERRQVRQIFTASQSAAMAATRRARAGESFVTLVDELSVDPQASEKKGALGLVTKGQLAPALDQVLWSMQIGEVTDPIKVGEQWYVLTLENTLPANLRTFDQVRNEIKTIYGNQIFSERWRAFVQETYDNASIEYSPDYDPGTKVDLNTTSP